MKKTRGRGERGTRGHGDHLFASPRLPIWSIFFFRVAASPTLRVLFGQPVGDMKTEKSPEGLSH
ncbi:hypothetical protein [Trichormus sp. NMC-1]|uniref:hypothetical protein n=1 Tax=Trichormus sp. NMC-1 TaxID=1853259 RepID=UPI0015A59628|nr:hypothetical protein [Trichormus sp. NMC-1]